ncbi:hypothetical protein LINPERPRIM_LOCUS4015, partial [Linum perenne]
HNFLVQLECLGQHIRVDRWVRPKHSISYSDNSRVLAAQPSKGHGRSLGDVELEMDESNWENKHVTRIQHLADETVIGSLFPPDAKEIRSIVSPQTTSRLTAVRNPLPLHFNFAISQSQLFSSLTFTTNVRVPIADCRVGKSRSDTRQPLVSSSSAAGIACEIMGRCFNGGGEGFWGGK